MIYDLDGDLLCDCEGQSAVHTDSEKTNAFLSYMNSKAASIGMSGTHYASPSGQTQSSYSIAQDGLKLGLVATSVPMAMDILSTPSRSFSIGGSHARYLSVTNNVISGLGSAINTGGYKFLAGKGGSLIYGSGYHRAQIGIVDVEDNLVVISLMAYGQTNYNNIFDAAVELCDMVKAAIDGQTPTEGTNLAALIAGNGGYAACVVPSNASAYKNLETPADLLLRSKSQSSGSTVSRYPASTSKVMTALCALDYITNIHAPITIKTADIESGSGSTFYDGDELTMYDALRIMLMESSNTLANAIARTIGGKILDTAV